MNETVQCGVCGTIYPAAPGTHHSCGPRAIAVEGISLRAWLAGQALSGLASMGFRADATDADITGIARSAVLLADRALAALKEPS